MRSEDAGRGRRVWRVVCVAVAVLVSEIVGWRRAPTEWGVGHFRLPAFRDYAQP